MSAVPMANSDEQRLCLALDSCSSADLGRMLEQYSPGASAGRRRTERIETLVAILSDAFVASRVVAGLSPEELRLLRVVARYGGTSVAALNLTGDRAANGVFTSSEAIERLLGRGLLFEEREGGQLVSHPLSATNHLRPWVWAPAAILAALPPSTLVTGIQRAAPAPERIEPTSFSLVRRDLYMILRLLRSRGVRLTRTGHVHRTDLRKLLEFLEQPIVSPRRDLSDPLVYGRALFLLRLMIRAGLAVPDADALRGSELASRVLDASEAAAMRIIFEAWVGSEWDEFQRIGGLTLEPWYYGGGVDVPGPDRLTAARQSIVDVLKQFTAAVGVDAWIDLGALVEYLRQTDPEFLIARLSDAAVAAHGASQGYGSSEYYHDQRLNEQRYYHGFVRRESRGPDRRFRKDRDWADVEGAFIEQVVSESLRWLGLVDLGYDGVGERPTAIRLNPLFLKVFQSAPDESAPRPVGRALVVQPNFEVLVLDALGSLDLLSELDEFAEPRGLDRAAVYTLTRAAFAAGLAAGWTEERAVHRLESASGEPLPQNVRRTLHDWALEFERVHVVRSANLLEAVDAAALDELLTRPAFSTVLARRLTPTVALLRPLEAGALAAVDALHAGRIRHVSYAHDAAHVLDMPVPGEVVVPPDQDEPYLNYRLAKFAARQPSLPHEPARYQVSRESLRRATAAGITIDEVLAVLSFKSRLPLTPDDILTLRGWAGFHAPFRYARVRAVELPSTVTWGDLSRIKALQPFIARILSPSLALVHEDSWEEFQAALEARGVTLRPELRKQPAAERRFLARTTSGRPSSEYGRPQPAAMAGGAARTPRLRRLTGRSLTAFIEQALDDDAPLIIEYRLRSERRPKLRVIEPRDLEVRGGAYYLQAYCRLRGEERDFRLSNIRGVALMTD